MLLFLLGCPWIGDGVYDERVRDQDGDGGLSERFGGRSRLERHRMLYDALGSLMEVEIHALAIRAFTPTEWTEQRS